MGRPKGAKNRPGYKKPGPREGFGSKAEALKNSALALIVAEEADNLTEAADLMNVSPVTLYNYYQNDAEWANQIKNAQNIKADRLEKLLDDSKNVVGLIFRLKKLRPEYRDSFKLDFTSEKLEKLLSELKQLDKPKEQPVIAIESPEVNGTSAEIPEPIAV